MEKIGLCIHNMSNLEYDSYMISCTELRNKLDKTIHFLMHFIFEGKCKDKEQWDNLLMQVCKAAFLKEYLELYITNIGHITLDFLGQFEEWYVELTASNPN